MGIDFSKFSKNPNILKMIQAALNNDGKIDLAELREMKLTKDVEQELMAQLAGNPDTIGDGFVKKATVDGSTILFQEKAHQGVIEMTDRERMDFRTRYKNNNIQDAFIKDGVMYFRDEKGELIKGNDGEYLKEVIYVEEKKLPFINDDGTLDVAKFQEYLNSLPPTDKEYTELMKDIESMNEENAQNFIERSISIHKARFKEMFNLVKQGEFLKASEAIYGYFQADCKDFDEKFISKVKEGLTIITGSKWAGPALYNVLADLADDSDENHISAGERILTAVDNVGVGLGDFIFSTEGLLTMGAIAGGEALLAKASSTLAPYIGAAIHSYFGVEGASLVADGTVKVVTGETIEEVAIGGQEIGHGLPMAGTVLRAGASVIKGGKEFYAERVKIREHEQKVANARDILGLTKNTPLTEETIKTAYKKKMHEAHPDKQGGSDEAKVKLDEAREILIKEMKRAKGKETDSSTQTAQEEDETRLLEYKPEEGEIETDKPLTPNPSPTGVNEAGKVVQPTTPAGEKGRGSSLASNSNPADSQAESSVGLDPRTKERTPKVLEGGVKDTELTEVAPFAQRLEEPVGVEDLRLSNKKHLFVEDIRAMVKNSPELSQNEWVQNNLDKLIDNCQPRVDYWNNPIKEAAENVFIKITKPNLKSNRLRIVETLLSHDKLYNNKDIQRDIKTCINRCWSEKEVNNLCETLELLNEHIDESENINKRVTSYLIYSDISAGKKAVIINKIIENKVQDPQYWGDFINKFDESDDLDLAFEMIENEKFGVRFAANFFSGDKKEKIADFPYKKAFYETLKNDPEIECNSNSGLYFTQICKNNIDFITKNYKKFIKFGDFYSLCVRTYNCSPEYMEFLQQMIDDNVNPKTIITFAKLAKDRSLSFAKEQYKNPKVKPDDIPSLVSSVHYRNDKPINEDFVRMLIEDEEFPNELVYYLANEYNEKSADGIMKLYNDKEIPREYLSTLARTVSAPELTQERVEALKTLISRVNIEDSKKPEVQKMVKSTITSISLGCGEFAKKLLSEAKSLPVAQTILGVTKDYNVHIADRLVFDMGLDMSDKIITDIIEATKKENVSLVEIALDIKELSLDKIKDTIKKTVIEDDHDDGGNNGHPDEKRVERYKALLQNPKSREWVLKMLNDGWDIETVSKLYKTKRGFFSESNVQQTVSTVDSDTQFFMDFGLDEKQAKAIVKAVKTGDTIDKTIKDTAIKLINSGFPLGRIGEVLSAGKFTGEFNPQIVNDAILIKDLPINPLLLKNLPILKNITDADVAVKFKPKVKKQLEGMLNALDENIKSELKAKGFDLNEIVKKLNAQVVRTSEATSGGTSGKIINNGNLRNRASISGFERVVIDRYEPSAEVWRSAEETKKWAEQKYQTFKNKDVISIRGGEHVNTDEVNKQRREILDKWFDFIESENDIKDNPFIKVILADFVTKDVERDNSKLPPVFTKEKAKEILSKAQSDPNISFEKAYNAALNAAAKEAANGREVEIDGRKMTWYTVPKTDESHKNFEENAAKVRALSDGTNWCIRTWNAAPYIQKGNIHFLVDENGMTQVCVREDHGKIAEIQKRQQNGTIPVAYIDFIQKFVKEKHLKGCEDKIKETAQKKPEFDKKKEELQRLFKAGDYKSILHEMGISFLELPDGTLQISHYQAYIGDICLNDYGINENELLANVSEIMTYADFRDSNVTSLPNLRVVGGELNFGYADISNLKKFAKN